MTTWLTPEDVAQELGMHVETIRVQCRAGDWPGARKFGPKWRIPAVALEPDTTPRPLIAPPSRRSRAQQRRTR